MRNKGQVSVFFILMMAVVFFILGLALTPAIMQSISEYSNTGGINCSVGNSSQSDTNKANCTSLDTMQFLFIGTIFGLAGLLLSAIALR